MARQRGQLLLRSLLFGDSSHDFRTIDFNLQMGSSMAPKMLATLEALLANFALMRSFHAGLVVIDSWRGRGRDRFHHLLDRFSGKNESPPGSHFPIAGKFHAVDYGSVCLSHVATAMWPTYESLPTNFTLMGTFATHDVQQRVELGPEFFGPLGNSNAAAAVQLLDHIVVLHFVLVFVIVELIFGVHHILGGDFLAEQEASVVIFSLRRKIGHLLEELLLLLLLDFLLLLLLLLKFLLLLDFLLLLRLLMVLLLLMMLLNPLLLLVLVLVKLRLLFYNFFCLGFLRAKNGRIVGLEVFVRSDTLLPKGLPVFEPGVAVFADDGRRTLVVFDLY